jgi:threonine/homoserine efflux transporter RhtA
MSVNFAAIALEPVFSIVMGILILAVPRFLNYFVAVYLVVSGILGLMYTVHH